MGWHVGSNLQFCFDKDLKEMKTAEGVSRMETFTEK